MHRKHQGHNNTSTTTTTATTKKATTTTATTTSATTTSATTTSAESTSITTTSVATTSPATAAVAIITLIQRVESFSRTARYHASTLTQPHSSTSGMSSSQQSPRSTHHTSSALPKLGSMTSHSRTSSRTHSTTETARTSEAAA